MSAAFIRPIFIFTLKAMNCTFIISPFLIWVYFLGGEATHSCIFKQELSALHKEVMHCSVQVERLKQEFAELKKEIRDVLKEMKEAYVHLKSITSKLKSEIEY